MTKNLTTQDPKRTNKSAIIAGSALIGMAILAPIAHFGILGDLIVTGDEDQTASNILHNQAMYMFAVICLATVAVLDVIVALNLKKFFAPLTTQVVNFMSWSRIIYAGIFMIAIAYLVTPVLQSYAGMAVSSGDISSFVSTFTAIWDVALLVFALHLVLLGWIFWRTSYTPTWLAPLLIAAGLGYAIDSIGKLFIEGYVIEVATVAFIGEVVLIIWLLVKGRTVNYGHKSS